MNTPNWRALKGLLAHLIAFAQNGKETMFYMGEWITVACNPDERRRREDEVCYSSACLAGHAALMFGIKQDKLAAGRCWIAPNGEIIASIAHYAEKVLGISGIVGGETGTTSAYHWMFYGLWHPTQANIRLLHDYDVYLNAPNASKISLNDAIVYLTKAIEQRDLFVNIDDEVTV